MDAKISEVARIQHIGWPTGIIGGLLLVSLGLELLARQVFGQTDVGTLLWALYLGFWGFVLSTAGLLLLVTRWLILWRRARVDRVAMHREAFSEPNNCRTEEPLSAGPSDGFSKADSCRA